MSSRLDIRRFRRFFVFLMVGALNTLFGFLAYALFIVLRSPTWLALIGGNVAGMAFNFFTTGHFVFSDLSARRLPRFVAFYLLVYFANLELIGIVNRHTHDAIVSQAVLTPLFAVASYALLSKWVFGATGAS